MKNLSGWCFRLAVLYVIFGMVMGEWMASSGDHSQMPVHAHINVLGWVSLALFGLFYKTHPGSEEGKLPLVQFILFNLGVIIQSIAVSQILRGNEAVTRRTSTANTIATTSHHVGAQSTDNNVIAT